MAKSGFPVGFIVMMTLMCVVFVSGMKFKCHRDICDASWQFCNDGEERCNTCTPEQCEPDVAKHIFNQCETHCNKQLTSTEKVSTTVSTTTNVRLPLYPQDSTWKLILTVVIMIVVLCILILVCISVRCLHQIRTQQIDAEKGSTIATYSTLHSSGEPEKAPLLEGSRESSGLHNNKMEDIQILAEATSNVSQMEHKQPSAPPSYSSEDPCRDRSMSPVVCEDDLPSPGNHQVTVEQDRKYENLGDTNLLSNNSLSSDDATCITRPKSVTC